MQTERGLGLVFFYEKEGGVRLPTGYILKEKITEFVQVKLKKQRRQRKIKTKHSLCKKGFSILQVVACVPPKKKVLLVFVLYSMLKQVEFFLEI